MSLNPWVRPVSTSHPFSPDKLDHALAYGGFSLVVFFCLEKLRKGHARVTAHLWAVAISIATLIGMLIEIAQSLFTSNRMGSVEDAVANAIGATLGCLVYFIARYIREKSGRR